MYGIEPDNAISEEIRRGQLAAIMFGSLVAGTNDAMQEALQTAMFDVQVHQNNIPINPSTYANYLVVNGLMYTYGKIITSVAGNKYIVAGNKFAVAGLFYYDSSKEEKIYSVPTNSDYWPAIYFVGGDITKDGGGNITNIDTVNIDAQRRLIFERIILQYQPKGMWAGLVINYV